jgi:hypothetical protein
MELKKSTIISKDSDKPKAPKSRHYVDNDKFCEALVERKRLVKNSIETGKEKPRVSEYLGSCILLIAKNVSNIRSFSRYTYKDEMVQDAVLVSLKYIDNFDPEVTTNPFGYFTKICTYAFISRILAEKKHTYIKFKATINSATFGELTQSDEKDTDNNSIAPTQDFDNDYMSQFIREYETKNPPKKKKEKKGHKSEIDLTEFADEDVFDE